MALPIAATAEDVRGIIAYPKNKPTGATISEAKAAVKRQLLDPRKLSAYKFWDITAKETDRVKLSKRKGCGVKAKICTLHEWLIVVCWEYGTAVAD